MLSNDDIADLYANNLYLKCVIVFRFLTSGVAIALLMKMLAHKSLVALMNFHALWTFILCLSTFVDGAINVYTHLTMRISSDLLVIGAQCLMRRVLAIVGVYGSVFSLLAMSIERYRASKKLATYEYTACGTKYVVFHLAIVACLSTIHCLVYGTTWIIPHCVLVSREGENVIRIIVAALVLTEIFTITSFAKLLSTNIKTRNGNSHNLTLSERYQLTENIRMLKLLLPIDSFNLVYLQGIVMPVIMLIRSRSERALEKQLISTNNPSNICFFSRYNIEITKGW
ncbi:hypothetical protein PRIPAC_76056 [Pristionchus pacificus]|uniref:G protein-coupled receptor n=1 Tax=Pristionchus pacificus TaxID=54126 RepID=A0A2A6BZZ9_PRIPA|nr:hypothetical protein PRIPAC_76056 [Pristionchus pacificus]|eukprot:PDM71407.1 G protein-coupled receptor [Pristionchus pacificus]